MPDQTAEASLPRLRTIASADLDPDEMMAIRELLVRAFASDPDEAFTDADWDHSVGGVHFVLDLEGEIVAHAAVIEREIHVGDVTSRTGYVEAVATSPSHQGVGFGSLVMTAATAHIEVGFDLGALGTGRQSFYERLGWLRWAGPSSVRAPEGPVATPDDDAYLMVLRTPSSPPIDPHAPISCDWRHGDVW